MKVSILTTSNLPQKYEGRGSFRKETNQLQPNQGVCLNLFADCYRLFANCYKLPLRAFWSALALSALIVMAPTTIVQSEQQPVRLPLSKGSSKIVFGVRSPSPTLQMDGSFTKFSGSMLLDANDITRSKFNLALDLKSAQLSPDQILQAVFLQTAIAHLKQSESTFVSEKIERSGNGRVYHVNGMYTWQGKSKRASIPIEIVRASPFLSEIRVSLNGKATASDTPAELQQLGGLSAAGSSGWAKATFIFAPRN